jgi:hypothetical protein
LILHPLGQSRRQRLLLPGLALGYPNLSLLATAFSLGSFDSKNSPADNLYLTFGVWFTLLKYLHIGKASF